MSAQVNLNRRQFLQSTATVTGGLMLGITVTPDAVAKDHFVIVDSVGVCEQDMTDSKPMEKKPTVSFEKLMQAMSLGNKEEDVLSSVAGRLARMGGCARRRCTER